MSTNYNLGIFEHGVIITADHINNEMRAINNAIDALAIDIEQAPQKVRLPNYFLFREEWKEFYAENKDLTFGWGDIHNDVLVYQDRLDQWRKKFRAVGGRPSTPRLPRVKTGGVAPWILLGAVAVGVTLVYAFSRR